MRYRILFLICLWSLCSRQATAFTSFLPRAQRQTSIAPLSAYEVSSPLHYRDHDVDDELVEPLSSSSTQATATTDAEASGVSIPLIRAIWFNQASILMLATAIVAATSFAMGDALNFGSLHWNGLSNFHPFWDINPTIDRVLEGAFAAVPMIALANMIEKSDQRDASHVNFSTTNMVISLFGRRKSAIEPSATSSSLVMILSAAIALSTGFSEEIVFRGYLPTAIASFTDSIPLALVGQAALFALAHISPKVSFGENKVVGGMQFMNGIWYGLVYLATGGDLLPCIVAHMLYDMHVLCETWCVINHQMDYTQVAYQQQLDDSEEQAIQRIQLQAGPALDNETLNFARRFFYAFDSQHQGSLTLSDVHRAVSYAFMKDTKVPRPEQVDETFGDLLQDRDPYSDHPAERLSMSEFLRLLFALKSRASIA